MKIIEDINLETKFIGKKIIYLETVGSTNTYLKEIGNIEKDGTVVISEEQTKGRGRLGRSFKSNSGEGIYMSILLKPNISLEKASFITLIVGASIIKTFNKLGVKSLIKWPNDIILNNKKLGGVLTELSCEKDSINYIVTGIGINVKTLAFDDEIKDKATSIYKEGYDISRIDIIREILVNFERLYNLYIENDNKEDTLKICRQFSAIINKKVYVTKNNDKELVTCIDINNNGDLVVKDLCGKVKNIVSGEVSIRGENGYI